VRNRATANEFASTEWQWVRNRQIANQEFRREYPIPPYTADCCCVELKLILENRRGRALHRRRAAGAIVCAMIFWRVRAIAWCALPPAHATSLRRVDKRSRSFQSASLQETIEARLIQMPPIHQMRSNRNYVGFSRQLFVLIRRQ